MSEETKILISVLNLVVALGSVVVSALILNSVK